jgi:hypothetical protein
MVFHLFHEDSVMHLAAAQAVKGADNDTLYLAVSIALTHQAELFPFAVLVAAPYFAVDQADCKAVFTAIGAAIGFLLVQTGVIFLWVSGNAAIDVNDSGHDGYILSGREVLEAFSTIDNG